MNELSLIFERIWINTYDVLEAAWTKWNFLKFTHWLVWGHCIWVDPYYLVQKAEELGYHPEVITAGRRINDWMWAFIASQLVKQLINSNISVSGANILILGLTFKENVPDFRNSKIADVIKELKEFGVNIKWYDPYSKSLNDYVLNELNLENSEIITEIWKDYDWIIYASDHLEFSELNLNNLRKDNWVIFDVKGKFRKNGLVNYKSL
jgi:UDP-N-acetyl-D-galactosamine dehydrogenase